MIVADQALQRAPGAKLLVVDDCGRIAHAPRTGLLDSLRRGDLVIANDAAILPASLHGVHEPTRAHIEIRLAARRSLAVDDVKEFLAIVFGNGDFRTRTEDRPPPPRLASGDRLALGPLRAIVQCVLGHPRLITLRFEGSPAAIWHGLAHHGRPIQYAHMATPLELWDVWTPIAGAPVAFEPPSASFALDWRTLAAMRRRGIVFATLTHTAGISSTGDSELDALLPFDEPYSIPERTLRAVMRTRAQGGRVVAVGTTVVRALEDSAAHDGKLRAGAGVATLRIGESTRLKIVDAILTGTHPPGTSHYALLRAFVDEPTLCRVTRELDAHAYRTHEFGDSMLVERSARQFHATCGAEALTAA